ncbi:hypothetical protein B0S90_2785 [Caldicellulosiruptor bescii]|uniref:Uncharacterized protein n=1 Tax=Caldicellulosiruptor bescii TaxID=31899 RepID=A0ABY1S6F8_CALBS|nr:hypothetical protein B0S87_1706 [Caldicellulosiruptor bescii]PBC91842.1 hypothetical protein B0S89_2287 [Caldicellulosiruptor bescii]PBD02747.1 hypothetical protein B0S85_0287 [Caldicellulosiruptor bescii]PBD07636.1 hypothetical protein B0S90_2785 [Caldicellulosiruptor bescii]PBD10200.1 hypothetical protein B0S84_2701 [Caldicellulosiruptor bescii]
MRRNDTPQIFITTFFLKETVNYHPPEEAVACWQGWTAGESACWQVVERG